MGTSLLSIEARATAHHGSINLLGNSIGSMIPDYVVKSVTYILNSSALYELAGLLDHLIQRHVAHYSKQV